MSPRPQKSAGNLGGFFFIHASESHPDIMVDLGLYWILNVGHRGSDDAVTPLRLELTLLVNRWLQTKHLSAVIRAQECN